MHNCFHRDPVVCFLFGGGRLSSVSSSPQAQKTVQSIYSPIINPTSPPPFHIPTTFTQHQQVQSLLKFSNKPQSISHHQHAILNLLHNRPHGSRHQRPSQRSRRPPIRRRDRRSLERSRLCLYSFNIQLLPSYKQHRDMYYHACGVC